MKSNLPFFLAFEKDYWGGHQTSFGVIGQVQPCLLEKNFISTGLRFTVGFVVPKVLNSPIPRIENVVPRIYPLYLYLLGMT
jgi:hypothetical protein